MSAVCLVIGVVIGLTLHGAWRLIAVGFFLIGMWINVGQRPSNEVD